jgi:predicted transcriptional regulator
MGHGRSEQTKPKFRCSKTGLKRMESLVEKKGSKFICVLTGVTDEIPMSFQNTKEFWSQAAELPIPQI